MSRRKVKSINQIYDELQLEEQRLLMIHLEHYRNIALNLYEWEGLPEGMESRHIEKALLFNGQAFFYNHENLGYLCLPCSNTGDLNVYGEPTRIQVSGHGFSEIHHIDDGVLILNNPRFLATELTIQYYCKKLAQIDSTMNTNLIQQKVPFIFATGKENEFTIKNLYAKMYSGEPAIFVNQSLLNERGDLNIQSISCEAPYILDKLQQHRFEVEKELLTFLGINTTIEKKERLLQDETNANNELITLNVEIGLREREKACEKLKEVYGLDVKVYAKDIEVKGGLQNGDLYDGDTRDIE